MERSAYQTRLIHLLDEFSGEVSAKLARFQEASTDTIEGIAIDLFVSQDGEGPFSIWARFEGKDSFVLDRQFDDERELFGVVWNESGWEPDVPYCPAGWTFENLEDAIVEVVGEWLDSLIPVGTLRWELTSPEGAFDARPLGPSTSL